MRTYKLFWTAHKWTGVALAALLGLTAVTGLMLALKKRIAWLQPPTVEGERGEPAQFVTLQRLFETAFAHGNPAFRSLDDVDRVDFRPNERTFKVVSVHGYAELQICAVTARVLADGWRPSDLIEDLHDGSWLGGWYHRFLLPLVACGLLFLIASGLWLWIEPIVRRRQRAVRDRLAGSPPHV